MKTKQWILFSLITLSNYSWTDENQPHPADWKKFCTRYRQYIPAVGASIIIGILTGGLSGYIDKKVTSKRGLDFLNFCFILTSWDIESRIRKSFILGLQHDMDSCNIHNPKNAMQIYSWAASWIAYIGIIRSRINSKSNNR